MPSTLLIAAELILPSAERFGQVDYFCP